MLHDDFVTFLRDFLTVANAYNAPDHYRISQFRSCLQGDARDLFESRMEPHTLNSWSQVQALAHQLFVPTDQHNTAWDYITTTKFRHGDNLDLHFSKFVKNAKIATNSQGEFMKQTARIHFIRSLPPDLMKEAGVYTFSGDEEMLQHLKRCIQFSRVDRMAKHKPAPLVTMANPSVVEEAAEEPAALEELVHSIAEQLQELRSNAHYAPRAPATSSGPEGAKSSFPRRIYPCGICGESGHNVMGCPLRPLMLKCLPDWRAQHSKETEAAKPLN